MTEEKPIVETPIEPPKPVESKDEKRAKSMIEDANKAADRIEAANKAMAENIAKAEALKVENTLAGQASAGGEKPKEKSVEEIEIDGAKELLKGTGYEHILD